MQSILKVDISTRLVAYKNAISPPTSPKGYPLEKWEGGGPFPPTNCQEKCPRNKVDVTCHLSTLIMVYCTYQESSRIWYSNSPENSSVLTWSCKRSGLTRFHSDHDFPRRSTKESWAIWQWTHPQMFLWISCRLRFLLQDDKSCHLGINSNMKEFRWFHEPIGNFIAIFYVPKIVS